MKAGDGRRLVWMLSESSVETWDDEDEQTVWTIPHSPALPAVARWLEDTPDALTCLEFIAGVATSAITSRCIQARARGEVTPTGEEARAQDVMDALLAALTTEEPA